MTTLLTAVFTWLGGILKSGLIAAGLYLLVRNKAISDVERERLRKENAVKDKQLQDAVDSPRSNADLAQRLRERGL